MQQQDSQDWRPLAFISQSLSAPERNYEIYDKEMLAIIRALEEWRHILWSQQQPFEIWSDHKNLEYWRTARNLTRRQARWALTLSEYNFKIVHKLGKSQQADPLSRNPEFFIEDADDNLNQVVLKAEHFKIATSYRGQIDVIPNTTLLKQIRECQEQDGEVAEVIGLLKKLGPVKVKKGLEEWNFEDGLIIFRGKIYVPKDTNLRREIVKTHHDPLAIGHPGRNQHCKW